MKVMAVDPGEKRLGIAVSDETGNLARPLMVIIHVNLKSDAAQIASIADEQKVELIIIGAAFGSEGQETPASRHASRLMAEICLQTETRCVLWDESGSTINTLSILREMNIRKNRRTGHQDDLAAANILQSYLDTPEELR